MSARELNENLIILLQNSTLHVPVPSQSSKQIGI